MRKHGLRSEPEFILVIWKVGLLAGRAIWLELRHQESDAEFGLIKSLV